MATKQILSFVVWRLDASFKTHTDCWPTRFGHGMLWSLTVMRKPGKSRNGSKNTARVIMLKKIIILSKLFNQRVRQYPWTTILLRVLLQCLKGLSKTGNKYLTQMKQNLNTARRSHSEGGWIVIWTIYLIIWCSLGSVNCVVRLLWSTKYILPDTVLLTSHPEGKGPSSS